MTGCATCLLAIIPAPEARQEDQQHADDDAPQHHTPQLVQPGALAIVLLSSTISRLDQQAVARPLAGSAWQRGVVSDAVGYDGVMAPRVRIPGGQTVLVLAPLQHAEKCAVKCLA